MRTVKRKTRSDKFSLTLHMTGQYCKKVKGKMHYFGSDKKEALQKYLDQSTYLHGHQDDVQQPKPAEDQMTLKHLCGMYLKYQYSKLQANDLTARHHNDQIGSLNKFMACLGHNRKVKAISTLDLQNYKRKLQNNYGSVCRLNLHLSIMKALFHWAKKYEILKNIPNIDVVSRGKVVHKDRFIFDAQQISKLLAATDIKMQALIWLGLNCGFGCTDCAELLWTDVDMANGRVKLPRGKTGVFRDLPLWPETVVALEKIPRNGKLVFYTSRGNPYVRTLLKTDGSGNRKYTTLNTITTMFSRLIKKLGFEVPKGTGFYSLRRTAATLAASWSCRSANGDQICAGCFCTDGSSD